MERKNFYIGILSLTAAVLMLVNYFVSQPAMGLMTIKDRDFGMVTARSQSLGDTLYVLDNRSGKVAIFSYDPQSRTLRPHFVSDMNAVFAQAGQ